MKNRQTVVAVFLLTLTGPAAAGVVTNFSRQFDESFESSIPRGQFFTGSGASMTFPYFDASLGQLNQVDIAIDAQFASTIRLAGVGQSPELEPSVSVGGPLEIYFDLTDLPIGTLASAFGGNDAQCTFSFQSVCDVTAPINASLVDTLTFTGADALWFVGIGAFAITTSSTVYIDTVVDLEGGASFDAHHAGSYAGEVALRYTFDPPGSVPAPLSLALVVAGCAGMAVCRRRIRPPAP
ncbi:MAG: choice-of-anchor E domain-containing protein [Gammaproteobacteria bacterium]|nr:choice-of-anchor E domain-containing protein [Gammaproteobacteria bacterium]